MLLLMKNTLHFGHLKEPFIRRRNKKSKEFYLFSSALHLKAKYQIRTNL